MGLLAKFGMRRSFFQQKTELNKIKGKARRPGVVLAVAGKCIVMAGKEVEGSGSTSPLLPPPPSSSSSSSSSFSFAQRTPNNENKRTGASPSSKTPTTTTTSQQQQQQQQEVVRLVNQRMEQALGESRKKPIRKKNLGEKKTYLGEDLTRLADFFFSHDDLVRVSQTRPGTSSRC